MVTARVNGNINPDFHLFFSRLHTVGYPGTKTGYIYSGVPE